MANHSYYAPNPAVVMPVPLLEMRLRAGVAAGERGSAMHFSPLFMIERGVGRRHNDGRSCGISPV
ncbi:hypothetical protein Pla8534_17850 [Lignipirellula cremea]|uniref:Uncharacterized protein n=1 Tax=Lignipirellula cremea TaxID=2528010 RepID=A0A518DQ60_9BACT|nr:hypothetical protein Pla8534_17850 [Lignipirellula cremea]